jgi:hypothetical protein
MCRKQVTPRVKSAGRCRALGKTQPSPSHARQKQTDPLSRASGRSSDPSSGVCRARALHPLTTPEVECRGLRYRGRCDRRGEDLGNSGWPYSVLNPPRSLGHSASPAGQPSPPLGPAVQPAMRRGRAQWRSRWRTARLLSAKWDWWRTVTSDPYIIRTILKVGRRNLPNVPRTPQLGVWRTDRQGPQGRSFRTFPR